MVTASSAANTLKSTPAWMQKAQATDAANAPKNPGDTNNETRKGKIQRQILMCLVRQNSTIQRKKEHVEMHKPKMPRRRPRLRLESISRMCLGRHNSN